jgi:hypothetical protein
VDETMSKAKDLITSLAAEQRVKDAAANKKQQALTEKHNQEMDKMEELVASVILPKFDETKSELGDHGINASVDATEEFSSSCNKKYTTALRLSGTTTLKTECRLTFFFSAKGEKSTVRLSGDRGFLEKDFSVESVDSAFVEGLVIEFINVIYGKHSCVR